MTEDCFRSNARKLTFSKSPWGKHCEYHQPNHGPFKWNRWKCYTETKDKRDQWNVEWRAIPWELPEGGWAFRDKVWILKDTPPGDYVLSFRWDCSKTPQIWSTCATIKIVDRYARGAEDFNNTLVIDELEQMQREEFAQRSLETGEDPPEEQYPEDFDPDEHWGDEDYFDDDYFDDGIY